MDAGSMVGSLLWMDCDGLPAIPEFILSSFHTRRTKPITRVTVSVKCSVFYTRSYSCSFGILTKNMSFFPSTIYRSLCVESQLWKICVIICVTEMNICSSTYCNDGSRVLLYFLFLHYFRYEGDLQVKRYILHVFEFVGVFHFFKWCPFYNFQLSPFWRL